MKITRRGFALISTLLFLGILFMMSVSIIMMSRQRVFSGLTQHHKSQALYLAEAGLAKAEVALESDIDWPGEPNGTVDGIPGTYEVHLATDLNDRNGSVINIGTDTPADSYRGENSVPKNSALLIVTANVSGQTYTLEALVKGKGSVGYMDDAILASGNIVAKGTLDVNGITALDDAKKVDGSMQSNDKSGTDNVVWQGSPGDTAHVTGNVGVGGASSGIKMAGAKVDGSFEANAPTNIPHTDIDAEVAKNKSHPAPTLVPLGTSTISSGKYSTGNVDINGDLVLKDGAVLYVDGDLKINGSISGKGTIYVTGDTTFRGDSKVTTNPDFSVALYSKGDVNLSGFDGTAYLNSMGGAAPGILSDLKIALTDYKAGLKSIKPGTQPPDWSVMDDPASALGLHDIVKGKPKAIGDGTPDVFGGYASPDTLGQLRDLVSSVAPAGETKTFLESKLNVLATSFSSPDDIYSGAEADVNLNFQSNGGTGGLLDTVVSEAKNNDWSRWGSLTNLVDTVDFDKLGTSYFQGAIYTQGHFVADNEVTIIGALMADGPSGGKAKSVTLANGSIIQLRPGDIYLGNRTSVTYVEDFFKDGNIDYTGPQLLAKDLWMGR